MAAGLGAWLKRHTPAPIKRRLRGLRPREREADEHIREYLENGRIPWSPGYSDYKRRYIAQLLADEGLRRAFRESRALPAGHGERLDERVVEYPWVLSRSDDWGPRLLDAGSTLNIPEILASPGVQHRDIIVYNLQHGWTSAERRLSYIAGDLRRLSIRDAAIDVIVCVSTLEHIGLDNTQLYTSDPRYREDRPGDYRVALAEFRRVLRPGGRLLVTVPFGRPTHLGWLQQFDGAGIADIVRVFDGDVLDVSYFKYELTGWRRATPEACAHCEYFDVHATPGCPPDYAAAARAVACLELGRTRR